MGLNKLGLNKLSAMGLNKLGLNKLSAMGLNKLFSQPWAVSSFGWEETESRHKQQQDMQEAISIIRRVMNVTPMQLWNRLLSNSFENVRENFSQVHVRMMSYLWIHSSRQLRNSWRVRGN